MNRDLDIMSRTVYGEASNQGFRGMLAVAYVIMNRSKERNQSPAEVCLAPKQFSCWNDGDPNVARINRANFDMPLFCQATVAALIAKDGLKEDPTHGSNHYYADYIPMPSWAKNMQLMVKIGVHIFLKG